MLAYDTVSEAEAGIAEPQEIEAFLRSIERRGFLMARVALGNEQDALDALQDAMFRLVRRYADRPPAEWRPLFYRILHNRITDAQRRRTIGQRLFGWLERDEDDADPLDNVPSGPGSDPAQALVDEQGSTALAAAVGRLPERQRQAFMLRCWEGLSTEETARAMGCSEGSVKTHYFRALHALRDELEEHRP